MAVKCPQENLPEWKKLKDLVETPNVIWDKLDGQIDKDGKPLRNKNLFDDLLKVNEGDYDSTYSQFLATVGDNLTTDKKEVKENIRINKKSDIKDALEYEVDPKLTLSEQALIADLGILTKFDKIKNKALQRIITKNLILHQGKSLSDTDPRKIENDEFIKQLKENKAEEALNIYLSQASKLVNAIENEYKSKKDELLDIENGKSKKNKKDVLNLSILKRWGDLVSAYDSLEEFSDQLLEEGKYYSSSEDELISRSHLLQDTITKKNHIKNLYATIGLDMLADGLSEHYDRFRNEYKGEIEKDYEKLSPEDQAKYTKPEWINLKIEHNKIDLDWKTISLMKSTLQKCSKDTNLILRYLDSMANTKDPAMAAAYKMATHATLQSENRSIKSINEIVNSLRKVEDKYGRGYNKQKIFDTVLEKGEDGKYTGNIIGKFTSKFWKERDKFLLDINKENLTPSARSKKIAEWHERNCPTDIEAYSKDINELLTSLKDKGTLSDDEYKLILTIENSNTRYRNYAHDLHESGRLNIVAADILADWKAESMWKYKNPSKEFKSKDWERFNKLSDGDPMKEFYNTFNRLLEEANSLIPFHSRLKPGQLPSMMKSVLEGISEGESWGNSMKLMFQNQFDVLADDYDRNEQRIADQDGNIRHFIPTYHTNTLSKYDIIDVNGKRIDSFRNKSQVEKYIQKNKGKGYKLEIRATPEDQSYDLPTILARFCKMAYDYHYKKEILPELEAIQYFVSHRNVLETDTEGNPSKRLTKEGDSSKDVQSATDIRKPKNINRLAEQYSDWMAMTMYGEKSKSLGRINIFGLHADIDKSINWMNKSTSLLLLAGNARAALNYVFVSEQARLAETFAHEHMSPKSWIKGERFFIENLPAMMGDQGRRNTNSLAGKLFEKFNLKNEPVDTDLRDATKLGKVAKGSSLYFLMKQGVFFTQSRLFFGMLSDIKAYNKDGKIIGDMINMYHVDDKGNLQLKPEVDLVKSGWSEKEQLNFIIKTKYLINTIHGEYGLLEKAAIERIALARMGTMFRKFILPGVLKRYRKGDYSERLGGYTEGYYRTTGKFLVNLTKDIKKYKLAVLSHEWSKLNNHEKANIIKTITDIGFTLTSMVLAGLFLRGAKHSDEDSYEREMWSLMAYQALRFKSEMLLYSPKLDEALSILKAPAAPLGYLESLSKLANQMCTDAGRLMHGEGPQVINQGTRKQEWRSWRDLKGTIPVISSMDKMSHVSDQLRFMNQSMILNPLNLFNSDDSDNTK